MRLSAYVQTDLHCMHGRIVDGQTESSSIAKVFADKFRDLYTSVPYDVNEMRRIQDDVKHLLAKEPSHYDCIFHTSDIKYAVSRLKTHKNDGCTGLTSDHIINAREDCLTHIALLFTAISIYGTAPDSFLHSTIVPIPKGKVEMYLIVLIFEVLL
jgi:hypothetical protein